MAPLAQICAAFKRPFSYSNFTNTVTDNGERHEVICGLPLAVSII